MNPGFPGRRRTVLVAGVPEPVAAAASAALRPHTLLLLRATPTMDTLRALRPTPDLMLVGAEAGAIEPLERLLSKLKPDPGWRGVPVLLGAPAWTPERLLALYRLHANACLEWPAPATAEDWLAALVRFWFGGDALLATPLA